MSAATGRRTKRRYAHELYPHPKDGEVRPLAVEVPYLYAITLGLDIVGTGWTSADPRISGMRTEQFLAAAHIALIADALQQELTGDEAWAWAQARLTDDMETVYERAAHHGVPGGDALKPYPCGTKATHDHYGPPIGPLGLHEVTRVHVAEDDCLDCTEPIAKETP